MMKIKKIAMQLCLSSAVLAAMPAFAAEVAQSSAQHYMVKNLNIGDLPVKTIVPITAKTAEQAITQAQVIASTPNADVAEFRIDLLEFSVDTKKVIALGQQLNQILKDAKELIKTADPFENKNVYEFVMMLENQKKRVNKILGRTIIK